MPHGKYVAASVKNDDYDAIQALKYNWSNAQRLTAGSTSVQSTAIDNAAVTITPVVDVFVAIGANPTAADAAGSDFIPAGSKFTYGIEPGNKVAVIQAGSNGGGVFLLAA